VSQSRQPVACQSDDAASGVQRSNRARRATVTSRTAAAHRKPVPGRHRLGGGIAVGVVGQPRPRYTVVDLRESHLPRSLARLESDGIYRGVGRTGNAVVWRRACIAREHDRTNRRVEDASLRRKPPNALVASRDSPDRSGPDAGDRRWSFRSNLRAPRGAPARIRQRAHPRGDAGRDRRDARDAPWSLQPPRESGSGRASRCVSRRVDADASGARRHDGYHRPPSHV